MQQKRKAHSHFYLSEEFTEQFHEQYSRLCGAATCPGRTKMITPAQPDLTAILTSAPLSIEFIAARTVKQVNFRVAAADSHATTLICKASAGKSAQYEYHLVVALGKLPSWYIESVL